MAFDCRRTCKAESPPLALLQFGGTEAARAVPDPSQRSGLIALSFGAAFVGLVPAAVLFVMFRQDSRR